jgi:hypothetical protein
MKGIIKKMRRLKVSPLMILQVFLILNVSAYGAGEGLSVQGGREILEGRIPDVARQYIGIPVRLGKDFKESGAVDNSHLFYLIYHEAARQSGLRFAGYRPMKDLLKNAAGVQRDELKNGDLIVLKDGHAALIYRVENRDKLWMIYASQKRGRVISFNSQNVVYEVYWLKELEGFFRLTDGMFAADR